MLVSHWSAIFVREHIVVWLKELTASFNVLKISLRYWHGHDRPVSSLTVDDVEPDKSVYAFSYIMDIPPFEVTCLANT